MHWSLATGSLVYCSNGWRGGILVLEKERLNFIALAMGRGVSKNQP